MQRGGDEGETTSGFDSPKLDATVEPTKVLHVLTVELLFGIQLHTLFSFFQISFRKVQPKSSVTGSKRVCTICPCGIHVLRMAIYV